MSPTPEHLETLYRPGHRVPVSGQYEVLDPEGEPKGREVTCVRGERFPPTPMPGHCYRLADHTRHRRHAEPEKEG